MTKEPNPTGKQHHITSQVESGTVFAPQILRSPSRARGGEDALENMSYCLVDKEPLVSVVLTVGARARFLREALASVLRQTYRNLQIIVACGASLDGIGLEEHLKDKRIVQLRFKSAQSEVLLLNEAIKRAGGQYIAYLDERVIYYPHHIARLLDALTQAPDCELAYGDLYQTRCRRMGDGSWGVLDKLLVAGGKFDRRRLFQSDWLPRCGMMHRRDLLDRTGPFPDAAGDLLDWDLARRLALFTDFAHINEITAERMCPTGETSDASGAQQSGEDDFTAAVLVVRSARPAKPWPKMPDLSIILISPSADRTFQHTLSQIYYHTFIPYQVLVPLPADQFAKLPIKLPNLLAVPVDPDASFARKLEAALDCCEGDFVAVVPAALPIASGWVEEGVFALVDSGTATDGVLLQGTDERNWAAVLRRDRLTAARIRFPHLGVRDSVVQAGLEVSKEVGSGQSCRFEKLKARAQKLQQAGRYPEAAELYELLSSMGRDELSMATCAAGALYQGGDDERAIGLTRRINEARPTVETLLLEARLHRRADRIHDAVASLQRAREQLQWKG